MGYYASVLPNRPDTSPPITTAGKPGLVGHRVGLMRSPRRAEGVLVMGLVERMRVVPPYWPWHTDAPGAVDRTLQNRPGIQTSAVLEEGYTLAVHQAQNSSVEIHTPIQLSPLVPQVAVPRAH